MLNKHLILGLSQRDIICWELTSTGIHVLEQNSIKTELWLQVHNRSCNQTSCGTSWTLAGQDINIYFDHKYLNKTCIYYINFLLFQEKQLWDSRLDAFVGVIADGSSHVARMIFWFLIWGFECFYRNDYIYLVLHFYSKVYRTWQGQRWRQ